MLKEFDIPAMHCNNGEENLIAEYAVFHYIDWKPSGSIISCLAQIARMYSVLIEEAENYLQEAVLVWYNQFKFR